MLIERSLLAAVLVCSGCSGCEESVENAGTSGHGGAGGRGTGGQDAGEGGQGGQGHGGQAAACEIGWAARFADSAGSALSDIVIGPDDGIWALGNTSDVPDVELLDMAPRVLRFDASGAPLWQFDPVVTGFAGFFSIDVDARGNSVVLGIFDGTVDVGGTLLTSAGGFDAMMFVLDANGAPLWAKRFGDSGDAQGLMNVEWLDSGEIVVAGWFNGSLDLGGGPLVAAGSGDDSDIVVARFSSAGEHLTSTQFGDSPDQFVSDMAIDRDGAIVLSGVYSGTPDFGGGPLPLGLYDGFLLKLDAAGSHVWSFEMNQALALVDIDALDHVRIAGLLYGVTDFGGGNMGQAGTFSLLLAEFDKAGQHVASKAFAFGSDYTVDILDMDVLPTGEAWIAGSAMSTFQFGGGPLTPAGGWDGFVVKLDASMTPVYQRALGDAEDQFVMGLGIDSEHRPVIGGRFQGTIDLCPALSLEAAALPDAFLIQLGL